MKKISDKLLKIIMLISMIFSSLQTPIYVLADELSSTSSDGSTPTLEKGDMKLGEDGEVTKTGTVSTTSESTDGKISVKKTVTKDETVEGRFKVDFEIVGKESEESTPVYVVLVFDRSGSMCDSYYDCTNMTKWDNATQAAYDFSKIIIDNIPSSKIALVTFSKTASQDRGFEHKYLGSDTDKSIFGSADGGTNLHDGLIKAKSYLDKLDEQGIPEGAKKYVVVMSDGQPTYYMVEKYPYTGSNYEVKGSGSSTSRDILNATLKEAKSIKDLGTEIYSIGYSLSDNNILNDYRYDKDDFTNYSNWKAKDVLKNVASADTDTSKDAISHYQDASNSDKIKDAFEKIAKNIVLPGKEAVLTDNIGNNFKFVSQLDNSVGGTNSTSNSNGFGGAYISNEITEITKNSIKFSFNIDIDKDSPTGWYQTNNGFNLVYKDNNGNEQIIKSDKDPYVYWVQNEYDYIVNYYKDEISGTPFKSDTRTAPKGTIINESNVLKDKYLSEAGVAYEYKSISPESITITNDGETKVIDVLYVKAYGTLKVSYVDTEKNPLLDPKEETKEVGTSYKEEAPTIYGYTLTKTTGIEEGTYIKGTTEIIYEYTKNAGSAKNEIVKTQTNAIVGANSTFKYVLTYNGEIENYVGDATLTLTDTLPYDVKSISYDTENCTFDDSTRTLTCTKTYDINEQNRVINEVFTFEVVYKGLVSELELNVKNEVNSTLTFGEIEVPAHGETTDKVLIGTVIAKYVDEAGNKLADEETSTGLGDTEYKTSEKTIYGYTLKGQPENKNGSYIANETIEVKYVYTQNAGKVTENDVIKTGPENITSVNGTFNYTLTYNGKIEDYKGKATLTLTDILPYELDETKSTFTGCTYSNKVLTCVKEFDIDENNQEVSAKFDLELVFKDVDSNIVVNKVDSLLTYGNNNEPGTSETETEVFNGTVIAKYVDEANKELVDSVTSTGLGDTKYETSEKTIYGYTLKGQPENKNGKYVANETIEVIYVYSKNAGSTPKNEVVKTQTNTILGANSTFKYTLTYNGEIEDYVGDATLTLTDILPYDVESIKLYDTENCSFDDSTRTLTCTKTYDINEQNRVINEVFTFEVVYKGLVSELELNVKNEVNSKLTFGKIEVPAHGETTDKVLIGTVIAKYVDEANEELVDSVTSTGLGDTEYKTSEKTIYGYTLKGQPENKTGKYAANETIYVIYVYTKNAGEVTENKVTKTGPENITSVNGTFNYTLTYNGKVEDYVGKATLTLTDTLPYELEDGSEYEGCTYSNKVLTCVKEFDIDENNQEVSAKFDLELKFKGVDSNIVVNKVDSLLTYGNNNEPGTSETETEVFKGTVVAIYKNRDGELLTENIVSTGLAGSDYDTEELEFLGYTLTKLPENKSGKYVANQTTTVVYIYDKNIGTSEEHLEKTGFEMVDGVDSAFEYKITYNLEVFDYVGDVNITLTDYLPFDIDLDKSDLGNVCKYNNGLLICEYKHTINTEEDGVINIEEDLVLYYKDIDTNKVVNRIESLVVYGDEKKFDEDEFITEIPYGQIKVNYVTEDGKELSPSEISIGLVGADYKTNEKYFDDYYLKEVIGNEEGKYETEEQEITYVYSEIPLPPQTGINSNNMDYLGILVFAIVVLIIKKRYV